MADGAAFIPMEKGVADHEQQRDQPGGRMHVVAGGGLEHHVADEAEGDAVGDGYVKGMISAVSAAGVASQTSFQSMSISSRIIRPAT